MALELLETNIVLDVYDHDGERPSMKSIALDDNTRYVFARLTYQGETYDIGSTASVKLVIIRPDKVGAQIAGEAKEIQIGQEDESIVTIYGAYAELDQPAIAVAGTLLGQFVIISGDQILRSQIFAVNNGEALDADEWAGQYDGYNLDELVEKVDAAVEKVDGMEADVNELKSGLSEIDSAVANAPTLKDSDADGIDLDVADADGNVLVRLESGGIETKSFRGFSYITYKSESKTYTGTLPFKLSINHRLHKGDRVVLHVERGGKPWAYGAIVTYYEGEKVIFNNIRGDNAWIEHVITEDVDEISAVYTSSTDMTTGNNFTLEVSLLGDIPVHPTVVTVKQDGTGDFTTLRGALDFIGIKSNDIINPCRIEIYPGTYDVLADYTDKEISNAEYTLTGFVGPKLLNGMYLVGMGTTPQDVVLTGSLDPDKWSSSIRNVISTLNCQGSCGIENVSIIGHNLRYCVHDDFTQPYVQRVKRHVKNCILRGYGLAYNPATTYGAGTRFSCGEYVFENVDFGENGGLHTSTNLLAPAFVHLINCKGHGFRIGDNETITPITDYSVYQFDNCVFAWINHRMDGAEPHVIVRGCGGTSPLYQFDPDLLYDTGDVVIVPNSGKESQYSGVGTVLEWYVNQGHGPRWRVATSYDTAHGIIVYEDDDNTYIQIKGYVRTDRTGITSPSLGDYVGISNGQATIVSDANTAFGRVVYIDNYGCGYIKLDWRA